MMARSLVVAIVLALTLSGSVWAQGRGPQRAFSSALGWQGRGPQRAFSSALGWQGRGPQRAFSSALGWQGRGPQRAWSSALGWQGRGAQTSLLTPRAMAPIDLTGYWVAIISEDWRWRMVTPAKGDFPSIPLNREGQRVAEAWDPAKDEATGEQCKVYGAPGLMRGPTRLHITWLDDNTLKLETDYGQQTRLFRFGNTTTTLARTWQGVSAAQWVMPSGGRGRSGARFGSMKSVTTQLRPGYLRKNGVPYSASTVFTEHWDVHTQANGDTWLVVTNIVEDPVYLQLPWITAIHFRKEPDGSKWDPTPCDARF